MGLYSVFVASEYLADLGHIPGCVGTTCSSSIFRRFKMGVLKDFFFMVVHVTMFEIMWGTLSLSV